MSQTQDPFQTKDGQTPAPNALPLALPDLTDGAEPNTPSNPIRIYVACLASYNNGILRGRWIDVSDEDTIWSEVQSMLKASPLDEVCEEWAIHDYEGFEGARVEEYDSFARVVALAEFITEHGELGAEILTYYGGDLEDGAARFDEYYGEYDSLEDYARQFTSDCGPEIPKSIAPYIDYEAMGWDWRLSGDILTFQIGTSVHIFGGH